MSLLTLAPPRDNIKNGKIWNEKGDQVKDRLAKLYSKDMFHHIIWIVMLPLMVLGCISAYLFFHNESRSMESALEAYGNSFSSDTENMLSSIRSYYLTFTSRDEFKWLKEQKEPPYTSYQQLRSVQNQLEGDYHIAHYIEEYDFINVEQGWILNNYGLFPMEEASNRDELEAFLKEQEENFLYVGWDSRPPKEESKTGENRLRESNYADLSGEHFVIKGGTYGSALRYILLIKLNPAAFETFMEPFADSGYKVEVLSYSGQRFIGNTEAVSGYLERHPDQTGLWGRFKGADNRKYLGYSLTDTGSGYRYYIAYDLANTWGVSLQFVAAALIVGVLTIVSLYLIRLILKRYEGTMDRLEETVGQQKLHMQELFLDRIVSGEADEPYVEEQLRLLELSSAKKYRMSVFEPKLMQGEGDQEEMPLPKPEELCAHFRGFLTELSFVPIIFKKRLVIITSGPDEYQLDLVTAQMYKNMEDEAMSQWGIRLSVGISRMFTRLLDCSVAYQECREALSIQTKNRDSVKSQPGLVLFEDYAQRGHSRNAAYDLVVENELKTTISHGTPKEAANFMDTVIRRLENKEIMGRERDLYIMRIMVAVMGVPESLGLSLNDIFPDNRANLLQRALRIYDYEQLRRFMNESVLKPVMEAMVKNRHTEDSELYKTIIGLIRQNDGNITLNECAAEMNYHPTYLWKVLKKEKNTTFTDLVNQVRIERAHQLLLTTELSVAEIAQKLHYTSVQNFIRFFSKMENTTPARYRREHRK